MLVCISNTNRYEITFVFDFGSERGMTHGYVLNKNQSKSFPLFCRQHLILSKTFWGRRIQAKYGFLLRGLFWFIDRNLVNKWKLPLVIDTANKSLVTIGPVASDEFSYLLEDCTLTCKYPHWSLPIFCEIHSFVNRYTWSKWFEQTIRSVL